MWSGKVLSVAYVAREIKDGEQSKIVESKEDRLQIIIVYFAQSSNSII